LEYRGVQVLFDMYELGVSGVYPSCALYREEWWADKPSMIPAYAKFASHYGEAYMLGDLERGWGNNK
jgi:hypothetical protein